jgi:hypothetical protein
MKTKTRNRAAKPDPAIVAEVAGPENIVLLGGSSRHG